MLDYSRKSKESEEWKMNVECEQIEFLLFLNFV